MSAILKTFLFLGFILVSFAGCQTPCDPHQGGFFAGIHGIASGCYEARVAAKEQAVQEELKKQQALESKSQKQKKELMRLQEELTDASQRLAVLEASIQTHRLRLEKEKRLKASDEAQLQDLELRLSTINEKIAEAKSEKNLTAEKAEDINRLTEQIEQVSQMIDEITGGGVQ